MALKPNLFPAFTKLQDALAFFRRVGLINSHKQLASALEIRLNAF